MKRWLIVFLMIFLPSALVSADSGYLQTGNQLLSGLEMVERSTYDKEYYLKLDITQATQMFMTMGFLMGVSKTLIYKKQVDMPNIPPIQLAQILKKWLKDHPELLHYDPVPLTVEAFSQAYPKK